MAEPNPTSVPPWYLRDVAMAASDNNADVMAQLGWQELT